MDEMIKALQNPKGLTLDKVNEIIGRQTASLRNNPLVIKVYQALDSLIRQAQCSLEDLTKNPNEDIVVICLLYFDIALFNLNALFPSNATNPITELNKSNIDTASATLYFVYEAIKSKRKELYSLLKIKKSEYQERLNLINQLYIETLEVEKGLRNIKSGVAKALPENLRKRIELLKRITKIL